VARPAVALIAFPNKAETSESNPGEVDRFSRNDDTVNGSSVGEDRLDVAEINPDGHRACALKCSLLSEFDKTFPIKVRKTKVAKTPVEKIETCALGASDPFADLFQVLTVKRDEVTKELDVPGFPRRRGFLSIYATLDIESPFLCVLPAEECVIDIFPLSSDLGSPGPRF
jgi:hypothetical protein